MEHDHFEFDEPAVRRAVQHAWGGEQAPQRLRGRISRLVATAGSMDEAEVPVSAAPSPAERWRSRAYVMAAAAVVVLGIGLLVLYYQGTFEPRSRPGLMAATAVLPSRTEIPLALTRSMLATHAACGKLENHHTVQDLDGNTYAALTVRLTADLGYPTLVRGIGSEWKFRGAGECVVGDLRGAHLLFGRGRQTISVFSLPSSCMNGVPPGAQFDGTVDNHPVAGFARPGTVYAVIGGSDASSSPPTVEAMIGIRDTLLSAFDLGCSTDVADEFLLIE